MLGKEVFPMQLADTWKQGGMISSLAVPLYFLKDHFQRLCHFQEPWLWGAKGCLCPLCYCWVSPILVGLEILRLPPAWLPICPPFPFQHGSVVPIYSSTASFLPYQEVVSMGWEPPTPIPRWCLCSSLEGATQIEDLTKKADAIYIFRGNWTWHCWFPETMLWKSVAISSKYREVEVKGIHRDIKKVDLRIREQLY